MYRKIILTAIAITIGTISYSQSINDEEKINQHILKFKKYFQKEKFKKAAKSFEWLLENSIDLGNEFYQSGILMYDYLHANEDDATLRSHYKSIPDDLKLIVDANIEEIYEQRFKEYGKPEEIVKFEPIDGFPTDFDIAPEYPEGMSAFYTYIIDEFNKSSMIKKFKSPGKGFVEFIVTKNGKIANVKMVKGFNLEVDQEITKIVENSPKWLPATKNGSPVPVRMVLPISIYD